MLKPGGTVLLATTKIVPPGFPEDRYPTDEQIHACLSDFNVIEVDILARALELGDATGRIANVVMMGILSTLEGMNAFPAELWLQALKRANSKPVVWAANYVAFNAGREIGLAQRVLA
jgi:indolepyruvate ferredoxin oxidoreductase alpha subunit